MRIRAACWLTRPHHIHTCRSYLPHTSIKVEHAACARSHMHIRIRPHTHVHTHPQTQTHPHTKRHAPTHRLTPPHIHKTRIHTPTPTDTRTPTYTHTGTQCLLLAGPFLQPLLYLHASNTSNHHPHTPGDLPASLHEPRPTILNAKHRAHPRARTHTRAHTHSLSRMHLLLKSSLHKYESLWLWQLDTLCTLCSAGPCWTMLLSQPSPWVASHFLTQLLKAAR